MNFIALVRRLASECGVSGSQAGNTPPTVIGQVGELGRLVNWVNDAWREVQGIHKWDWLWERPTITVLAGTNSVATDVPASRWLKDSALRPVPTSDGDWLEFLYWDEFRVLYGAQSLAQTKSVNVWSIRPDNAFVVNATPEVDTAITVERYRNPTRLVIDTDEPELPEDLHMLLVYKAMVRYANFDEAGAQRKSAQAEVIRMEADLRARCLPELRMGGPITDWE